MVQVVLVEDEIAERYGQVKAELATLGQMIPENDIWIAASVLAHHLTLVTRDSHFSRIKGLATVRWD